MAGTGGGMPKHHVGLPRGKTKESEGSEGGKEARQDRGGQRKDRKREGEHRLTGTVLLWSDHGGRIRGVSHRQPKSNQDPDAQTFIGPFKSSLIGNLGGVEAQAGSKSLQVANGEGGGRGGAVEEVVWGAPLQSGHEAPWAAPILFL